ncbi:hypothetical protein FACS189474_0400 [Bacteroidia bacterium]|nr:hypothetical protein FACS189474_0400 [Bacteroidia bacterium]
MDRNYILNHIEDFTAKQLFGFINQGIVTLDELKATGNLDASKRRAITNLQAAHDQEDDNAWNSARYTEQGCRDYLTIYPAGRHVTEARQQIDKLEQQRQQENTEKQDILERVRRNPNSFTPGMLRKYLNDNTINRSDLVNSGVPNKIIDRLDNISSPILTLGDTPDSIPDGYTEVYFWGIPGSGKTCALAAILSTAEKMGYLEIAQGPGYNYMLLLKNIFSNHISFLPAASPVDTTQYLPFALKKPDEKYSRSVSLIELSGEIFQCFLYKNANRPLPSTQHEDTFNSLIRFLNGDNRKIHFFFVDYDRENNTDADGYKQSDYLNAAATFFNDKSNNLFSKTTDAIYIVLTKSDLMDCEKKKRVNQVRDYLQNNNFTAFVNSLRAKCINNSINNKRILGTPFALGKVYFQQMCVFEDETSRNIIDILIRRIAPKKQSILDVFNR